MLPFESFDIEYIQPKRRKRSFNDNYHIIERTIQFFADVGSTILSYIFLQNIEITYLPAYDLL
jgi:hypothetical protein